MKENLYFRDRLYMTSAFWIATKTFFWYDEDYNWYIPISKDNEKGNSKGDIIKEGYTTDFDIYKYNVFDIPLRQLVRKSITAKFFS